MCIQNICREYVEGVKFELKCGDALLSILNKVCAQVYHYTWYSDEENFNIYNFHKICLKLMLDIQFLGGGKLFSSRHYYLFEFSYIKHTKTKYYLNVLRIQNSG